MESKPTTRTQPESTPLAAIIDEATPELRATFDDIVAKGLIITNTYENGVKWSLRALPQGPKYVLVSFDIRDGGPLFALRSKGLETLETEIGRLARNWPDSCVHQYGERGFLGLIDKDDVFPLIAVLAVVFQDPECIAVFGRSTDAVQHARPRPNPWSPSGMPVREPE